MSTCCGGDGGATLLAAKAAIAGMTIEVKPPSSAEQIKMEFVGDKFGPITFFGSKGREYRGGREAENKYAGVLAEDVKHLELTGQWRIAA